MKKQFLLILILASNLFGQGWNNIVTTSIEEPERTDIFTNSSGIHILIRNSINNNNIVYYNLNSAGDVIKTVPLETIGYFPNIVGTNDKIYAVYKTGNNIRVKYSTDNGSSWLTNIEDRPTTENDCNGVDAVYQEGLSGGVHIVWATRDGGTSGYETYYRRLAPDNSWADVEYKNVTDYSTPEYGGNPNVVVTPNRVHVSFNTDPTTSPSGLGDVKTRDKYYSSWQTPQTVVSASGSSEQSRDERLLVRGEYLYLFYNRDNPATPPDDLRFRTRRADNQTGWSNFTQLEEGKLFQEENAFEITKTNNDFIHILCKKYLVNIGWSYTYKYYNCTNWITEDDFDHLSVALRQIGLSSVSNDLFCTWVKWESPKKYMRFRQYDAIPLAPTGLTITENANHHPRLNWNVSPEPDRYQYNVYRLDGYVGGGWQYLGQSSGTTYTDQTLSYCHAVPPATCENYRNVSYRVTVVDYGSHESDPSNEVTARLTGGAPEKISINPDSKLPIEYSLTQNYPNPFNPTTTINYSLKTAGEVTLKVYDMLGTEVASLVNEYKEAGNYSVEFNASDLPSGMYVYRLSTSNFVDTKKLILLK